MSAKTRSGATKYQSLSFCETIDSFILFLAVEKGLSTNYQLSNRRSLQELAAWCQGRGFQDPRTVQTDDLTAYLSYLKTRPRRAPGRDPQKPSLSDSSMRLAIIAIRLFYGFLRSRHGLKRDPAGVLRTPKLKSPLPHTLNQLEANRLLAIPLSQRRRLFQTKASPFWQCAYTAPDGTYVRKSTGQTDKGKAMEVSRGWVHHEVAMDQDSASPEWITRFDLSQRAYPRRDRAILEVFYGCGLRAAELATLLLANVNLEERAMRVVGKGNKTRLVPIGRPACAAIEDYLKHERSRFTAATRNTGKSAKHCPELFLSRRGKRLTTVRVWQLIKELAALVGLEKNVYPHLFRHSFATHLLENGCDLRVIQELLGHADIMTTEIYAHVSDTHVKEVFKRCHPRSGAVKQQDVQSQAPAAADTPTVAARWRSFSLGQTAEAKTPRIEYERVC
jgi:integrase/recombinase XerD